MVYRISETRLIEGSHLSLGIDVPRFVGRIHRRTGFRCLLAPVEDCSKYYNQNMHKICMSRNFLSLSCLWNLRGSGPKISELHRGSKV